MARLALEATADPDHPGGDDDAKPWAHRLVDGAAFVGAHDHGAPPGLVLEVSGGVGGSHRFGSGDGQLPHPDTTYVAYAFKADDDGVAANPGTAGFSGAVTDSAAFSAVPGDSGTFKATLASGPLDLGRGDRLDVSIASLSADPVAALLFDGDTGDVFGQLNHALACGGEAVGCPTAGLHFEAAERATYLLDVSSTAAAATTGSPGRSGTPPACPSRSPPRPAAPTATASRTAAPGRRGRSPAGRSARS